MIDCVPSSQVPATHLHAACRGAGQQRSVQEEGAWADHRQLIPAIGCSAWGSQAWFLLKSVRNCHAGWPVGRAGTDHSEIGRLKQTSAGNLHPHASFTPRSNCSAPITHVRSLQGPAA